MPPLGTIKAYPCESYETTDGSRICITPIQVLTDPVIYVFTVSIENKNSVWMETFGSRSELEAYLRGLQSMASMCGREYLNLPALPPNEHFRVIAAREKSESDFFPGAMPGAD